MYIIVENGVANKYTLAQLRRDNPNVSFPKDIPDSTLAEFGVFPLAETVPPSGDVVEEVTPALIDGVWEQAWEVRDFTPEEVEQNSANRRNRMVVTPRQARLALLSVGKLADIDTAISALDEPTKLAVQIEWEYATTIERNSPWVISMTESLGMTELEIDLLFEMAKEL